MINMLRKGIKFSIQRVYFPQSYFESRHYGKRFNSIGKFKSLTFQLRAIYFHTFAVDMSVEDNKPLEEISKFFGDVIRFLRTRRFLNKQEILLHHQRICLSLQAACYLLYVSKDLFHLRKYDWTVFLSSFYF